jgi:hypothetical protein
MTKSNRILITLITGGIVLLAAQMRAPALGQAQGDDDGRLARLEKGATKQAGDIRRLTDQLARLAQLSPPVGACIDYVGQWPPFKADGTRWTEAELGWAVCDGRPFTAVVGTTTSDWTLLASLLPKRPDGKDASNLPNHLGCFKRAVDWTGTVDPDGKSRVLGSYQSDAIVNHRHHVNLTGGDHQHQTLSGYLLTKPQGGDPPDGDNEGSGPQRIDYTPSGGSHSHDGYTGGGDQNDEPDGGTALETRPRNVSTYSIVRFK